MITACAISQITRIELLSFTKLTAEEEQVIQKFIARVTVITLSEMIEVTTINFRRIHGGKLPDAFIIATALAHNLELITLDNKMKNTYLAYRTQKNF